MRVNIYAEEMTDRLEIIRKEIDGHAFTGLRFYLELPVTVGGHGAHRSNEAVYPPINGKPAQVSGPFIHHPGDDDSSAVTFWGKRDLREVLRKALEMLDAHYAPNSTDRAPDKRVGDACDLIQALLLAMGRWGSWEDGIPEEFQPLAGKATSFLLKNMPAPGEAARPREGM